MRLVGHGERIRIEVIAIFLVMFAIHMNVSLITKLKIFVLINGHIGHSSLAISLSIILIIEPLMVLSM